MFEISHESIQPDSRLYEDLDIDSLDAVDLIGELRRQTGISVAPERFRRVRTVQDIADTIVAIEANHEPSD
ncbi:acyl carrier protein [Salinisphaera sp. USBA-960]|nr:acyl carrier protein [Salifodinibacter halophilus]NNC25387.1 acyl carrier protein [Salifodinibacter halophilus]